MSDQGRTGFTIIELLVVAVLGSLIVGAAYQMLVTNQRINTVQSAHVEEMRKVRAASNLLFSELREISRTGGDLLGMGRDWVQVRAQREFGLVCAVDPSGSPLTVQRIGSWFEVGDSVFVFADNRVEISTDDTTLVAVASTVDTTRTCTGSDQAQDLRFPLIVTAHSVGDSVRVGAPIRAWETFTYGLFGLGSEYYLARRPAGGSVEYLLGPFESDGVRFRYLDSLGVVTSTQSAVYQIEFIVKGTSSVLDGAGNALVDSLVARAFLRN